MSVSWEAGVSGGAGLLLIILAIILLTGRGEFLIVGYTALPQHEKEKYDGKALCQFLGKMVLPVGVVTVLVAVGYLLHCDMAWVASVYPVMVMALVSLAVLYPFLRKRKEK